MFVMHHALRSEIDPVPAMVHIKLEVTNAFREVFEWRGIYLLMSFT